MSGNKKQQPGSLTPTNGDKAKDQTGGSIWSVLTDTVNNPESREYLGLGLGTAILAPVCPPAAFSAVIVFGVYKGWQFFFTETTTPPEQPKEAGAA